MDTFRPDEALKKVTISVWKQIFRVIFASKKELILLLVFATVLAVTEAFIIPINEYAITNLIETYKPNAFVPFIIMSVVQIITFAISVFLFIYYGSRLEAKVRYKLREESFKNLQKLPFSYYDTTKQGWIMARMTSDTNRLSRIVSWGLQDMIWSFFYMIVLLVILFIREWRLALLLVALIPILIVISLLFRKKVLINNRCFAAARPSN